MVATVLILLATEPLKGGPWAGNTWLLPSLSSGAVPPRVFVVCRHIPATSCLSLHSAQLGDLQSRISIDVAQIDQPGDMLQALVYLHLQESVS